MYDRKGDSNPVYDIFEQLEKLINSVCKTREISNNSKIKGSNSVKWYCWNCEKIENRKEDYYKYKAGQEKVSQFPSESPSPSLGSERNLN